MKIVLETNSRSPSIFSKSLFVCTGSCKMDWIHRLYGQGFTICIYRYIYIYIFLFIYIYVWEHKAGARAHTHTHTYTHTHLRLKKPLGMFKKLWYVLKWGKARSTWYSWLSYKIGRSTGGICWHSNFHDLSTQLAFQNYNEWVLRSGGQRVYIHTCRVRAWIYDKTEVGS